LGQEEKEFEDVKEVPWSMRIPMLVLVVFTLVVGVMPGLLLNPISSAMGYLNVNAAEFSTGVIFNAWDNQIDMFTIMNTIGVLFVIAASFITLKGFRKGRYVTTKDIHTSGEIPTENENLTYAVDFYKPFERALGSILKPSVDKFYKIVADTLEDLFDHLRYIYTGNGQTYAMYVVLFLVVLILFSGMIFGVKL
jgi:NADH:ubiquinone oxidoreductase subunit 5 (subunit L)/multisubunit Na+/H+ antiporter MnhA subunit